MHVHDDHAHPHEHDATHAAGVPQFSDPAQASLAAALRSSFNVLRFIMIGLAAAYLGSGFFTVRPGEKGLVARLGVLRTDATGSPVLSEGARLVLPDPIDEKIRITGRENELVIDTFLFRRANDEIGKPLAELSARGGALKPGVDGAMFTGDRNLSHGLWTVQYKVADARKFVLNVGESTDVLNRVLARLAESAVVHTVSSRRVEEVTRGGVTAVAAAVAEALQAEVNRLDLGVAITKVSAETIAPRQVKQAFDQVSEAENEKLRLQKEAEKTQWEVLNSAAGDRFTEILDLIAEYGAAQLAGGDDARLGELQKRIDATLDHAGGGVAVMLQEAQARASDIRERARREVDQFTYYLELYRKDPELTVQRLWADMKIAIQTSKTNEMFFLPSVGDTIEILINRDPNRKIKAELEGYRARRFGAAAGTGGGGG
ncbi:MAG: hypothetical protein CHACPFDD_02176 [Phycisphaerae bacterium]|nr:hypothetical protein [Phycisphaerae bacterium]